MSSDMIKKAKANAKKNGIDNVDFRLDDIEKLPVIFGVLRKKKA